MASNAVIEDADGNDVTSNYDIKYVDGQLTVTKASIPIEFYVEDKSKDYDGTPLWVSIRFIGDLAEGDTVHSAGASVTDITNVGTTTSAVTSVSITQGLVS